MKGRNDTLYGVTQKTKTPCGSLYVTVNFHDDVPFEVFTKLGKSGGCAAAQCESLSRLVSLCLRHGVAVKAIVKQLKGIRCHAAGNDVSCSDCIASVIEHITADYKGTAPNKSQPVETKS